MNLGESVWDATVFTKNRNRLLEGDVAREFLSQVVRQAQANDLTSDEHFTVDGTLIQAWASLKSFQRKDQKKEPPDDPGNSTGDFHGEKRSNQSHESPLIRMRCWRVRAVVGNANLLRSMTINGLSLASTSCQPAVESLTIEVPAGQTILLSGQLTDGVAGELGGSESDSSDPLQAFVNPLTHGDG